MAVPILVLGDTGTGKSTSLGAIPEMGIKGLNPKETAIINVKAKPLPFKGSMSAYQNNKNYAETRDPEVIVRLLHKLAEREDIKNVVVDDAQYILSGEWLDKSTRKDYDKYTEMGKHIYDIIEAGIALRPDQNFIYMSHSDLDERKGVYKIKTIGRMLDEKIVLEGLFLVVLYTNTEYDPKKKATKYFFITQTTEDRMGNTIRAKSPAGMFPELEIPNDLGLVVETIGRYYGRNQHE